MSIKSHLMKAKTILQSEMYKIWFSRKHKHDHIMVERSIIIVSKKKKYIKRPGTRFIFS